MPPLSASLPRRTLATLAGSLLLAVPALAAPPKEGMQFIAGIGWAFDDNLLRVADDAPPFDGRRSDAYRTLEGGVVYKKRISRQRIEASAKVSKVKFDHFDQLDYSGRDLVGTWFWEAGKQFEGRAETLYVQTLAPYTDFNSDERNLRQQRRTMFDAGWKLHPDWKLRAGAARDKYTYALPAQRFNNRTEKVYETELLYQPGSGSSVGLVARRVKGAYPYRRPFADNVLTDDFTQDELKARVHWLATGATTVQALAGYVRRDQPSYGAGTTSGFDGRITVLFSPQGKLSYTGAVWRAFAPIESPSVSYTLNRGLSLGASWSASAKLMVDAGAVYEKRDYTARTVFAGSDDLGDAVRSASLRATWQVRPTLQVSASYAYQARTGSPVLGTGKFGSNMVMASANLLF